MNVCGLIVEYNPFHNGHAYHMEEAKKKTNADCVIAVMSGNFLQRGEPAIMDKYHRTRAALETGIDIVVELPFVYAVQSSDLFAKGSVLTLNQLGVDSICFGSESGNIQTFIQGYYDFVGHKQEFQQQIKKWLSEGYSFPEASKMAYRAIGLTSEEMDLSKPNNILGFSYVRTILEYDLLIQAHTIKRRSSNYHDTEISGSIASATSIRKQILDEKVPIMELDHTMPKPTIQELLTYQKNATTLHHWENYYPLLHYRVLTMSNKELAQIHGVEEGLEHRIKKAAKEARSFYDWVEKIKTKRYTWTRIQRIFVHLLTNTRKEEVALTTSGPIPYVHLLGLTQKGQAYINAIKKDIEVPIYSKLSRDIHPLLEIEERASNAYYSILPYANAYELKKQEFMGPIIV